MLKLIVNSSPGSASFSVAPYKKFMVGGATCSISARPGVDVETLTAYLEQGNGRCAILIVDSDDGELCLIASYVTPDGVVQLVYGDRIAQANLKPFQIYKGMMADWLEVVVPETGIIYTTDCVETQGNLEPDSTEQVVEVGDPAEIEALLKYLLGTCRAEDLPQHLEAATERKNRFMKMAEALSLAQERVSVLDGRLGTLKRLALQGEQLLEVIESYLRLSFWEVLKKAATLRILRRDAADFRGQLTTHIVQTKGE